MCTNNTEMSDGEMPLIRLAWPMVRGRTRVNFSLASFDKEGKE
jgi:hypothetical protein